MYLTEWWQAFSADLDNLATKVNNSSSEPWIGARAMIAEGIQIEGNLLRGTQYATRINQASQKLGAQFFNTVSKKIMYLPEVNSTEELLFAWTYYKHLQRYSLIDQGNAFSISYLTKGRPEIHCAALALKRKIDAYCSTPVNIDALCRAFPELVVLPGDNALVQIEKWLACSSVVEKFVQQLSTVISDVIKTHEADPDGIHVVFDTVEISLNKTITGLRAIAAYKKFIELLNEGIIVPEDLSEPDGLRNNYPEYADMWLDLNADIPKPSYSKKVAVTGIRAFVGFAKQAAGFLGAVMQSTIGILTPQFINSIASKTSTVLGNLTQVITPDSLVQRHKHDLIKRSENNILKSAAALNCGDICEIKGSDFKNMNADEVNELTNKVALIHSMVGLQKGLVLYQQKNITTYVEFSLSSMLKPITELLSRSFMRHLIFNKVLLILEAEHLRIKVTKMIDEVQKNTSLDSSALKEQVENTLTEAKKRSDEVCEKNMFVFFRQEGLAASKGFKDVVERATNVCVVNF
jgi:hypothetical protein